VLKLGSDDEEGACAALKTTCFVVVTLSGSFRVTEGFSGIVSRGVVVPERGVDGAESDCFFSCSLSLSVKFKLLLSFHVPVSYLC
jgi:hypothetical protein